MMTILSIENRLAQLVRAVEGARQRGRGRGWSMRAMMKWADLGARSVYHVWRNRRYLTPVKLINMGLIQIQCVLKTERVVGMPYRMKIEPTNICNTHCQLCPTGLGIQGRAKGVMPFETYAKLVDELKRYLYTLDLSMWGDPLIVPDIYRMIRHAHDRRIWTYLSSNLHAFKPEKGQAEALVKSGLDMLTCSLHGATQETYERYQPGKKLEGSLGKIAAIVEAKKRLGSATPVIQLNFVVTRFNEHEVESFERLAEGLGCRAVFSSPSLNLRFLDRDVQLNKLGLSKAELDQKVREYMDQWLPRDEKYVAEPYRLIREGHYRGGAYNGKKVMACEWPWKDSVVNFDGSVVACCGVYETSHDMGNVKDRPFHEIWNSRSYRMARRSFRKRVEAEDGVVNPCRECPGYMI